jgi:hypothetical protein
MGCLNSKEVVPPGSGHNHTNTSHTEETSLLSSPPQNTGGETRQQSHHSPAAPQEPEEPEARDDPSVAVKRDLDEASEELHDVMASLWREEGDLVSVRAHKERTARFVRRVDRAKVLVSTMRERAEELRSADLDAWREEAVRKRFLFVVNPSHSFLFS